MIRGVLFDIGYTLCDETPRVDYSCRWLSEKLQEYQIHLSAEELTSLYARTLLSPDRNIPSLFVQMCIGLGLSHETSLRIREQMPWEAVPLALFPDCIETLQMLKAAGLKLGVLANQPPGTIESLEELRVACYFDDIWISDLVGLRKPDPAFFQLALDTWNRPPQQIAYVGDRPDNDVAPAKRLGLYTVRVLLGPHKDQPARSEIEIPHFTARSLKEAAKHILGKEEN